MAVHKVSTWSELVSALLAINTSTESETIQLTADIDCNYDIPQGVDATIVVSNNAGGNNVFTIDGTYMQDGEEKHHMIRNLRTHVVSPVSIFQFTANNTAANWVIRGIDFANLILYKPLIGFGWGRFAIDNCRFVGTRKDVMFEDGVVMYNSCFFNTLLEFDPTYSTSIRPNRIHASSSSTAQANFCWFKEKQITLQPNKKYTSTCYGLSLNGCRIDGEITAVLDDNDTTSTVNAIFYNGSAFIPIIQNVMDCTFVVPDSITDASNVLLSDIDRSREFGVVKKSIKTQDGTVLDTSSWEPTVAEGVILEPIANMANVAQLSADGFDIIVPTT